MLKNKNKIKREKILKTDQKYVYTVKAEKLIIRLHLFYKFFYAIRRELSKSYAMRLSFYSVVNF
jgi:hypothetical protein